MIAARLTLTLSLLLAAAANAHPHHQQLFYTAGFQSPPGGYYYIPQADAASVSSVQRYAAPVPVAAPGSPQYVLHYPGGGQNNFVYGRADLEPRQAEDENRPTIWNLFNVFQRPSTTPKIEAAEDEVTTTRTVVTSSTVATTIEETTPNASDEASVKPEKITDKDETMLAVEQSGAATGPTKASLEDLDEGPLLVSPPSPDGRQFTLVQQPQFFGNYDFLSRGGDNMHQRFGLPSGAVSNFLLFRNAGFAGTLPAQQPGRPLKQQMEENDGHVVPGSAALAFQQVLKDAQQKDANAASTRLAHIPGSKHVDVSQVFPQGMYPHFYVAPSPQQPGLVGFEPQVFPTLQREAVAPGVVNVGPGYQNVFLVSQPGVVRTGAGGIVVDADALRKEDVDQVEAEQAGPSVAQAKPQAIALAGVGGVAAASPVATAVVGPGGLAVSAPTATAVAGPSGGGSLVGPAQAAVAAVNKHVTSGGAGKLKTRTGDQQNYDDEADDEEDRY